MAAYYRCHKDHRTMSIFLDDLSPAALDTLADLIEQRLENAESHLDPVTWHQAQARQNAVRELSQALMDADLDWVPAAAGHADEASPALH
jgi:hypothetical protein